MSPARALCLLLLVASCGEAEGPGARSLRRLERMAFVPAGQCVLPRGVRSGLDCSTDRPLLIDRFEVTRAEWRECVRRGALEAPAEAAEVWRAWPPETDSWPASWLTLDEARGFAAAAGARLPTAREWMRVAAGTRAQRLPWGAPAKSVSNSLELGLERPTPVGCFERGTTVTEVYDLVGNVAEWVEGTLLEDPAQGDLAWAMGGSYLSRARGLFLVRDDAPEGLEFAALDLRPGWRSIEVGLRLCAYADEFLLQHAARWAAGGADGERLRAVGRRWGCAAVPLLEGLAAGAGAPPALRALLEGARG